MLDAKREAFSLVCWNDLVVPANGWVNERDGDTSVPVVIGSVQPDSVQHGDHAKHKEGFCMSRVRTTFHLQHEPHAPWFLTLVTNPFAAQSIPAI